MFKLLVLAVLVSACCAQVQFPLKAVGFLHGVIMQPNSMQMLDQLQQQMAMNPQGQQMDQDAMMKQAGITMIGGRVDFFQQTINDPTQVRVNITVSNSQPGKVVRGLHVHAFGISTLSDDVTEMCGTTGGHYNPAKVNHGSIRTDIRHAGDIGNIVFVNGQVLQELTVPGMKLAGDDSIVGRAIVLHEKADDEGLGTSPNSKINGNAGSRIACGNIVYIN
jgi:Cu-Zn family superoxide dismutase